MKKAILYLMAGLLIIFNINGCVGNNNNIIPDNGHNGGNNTPEVVKTTVLVESYISKTCPGCAYVSPILERLAKEYSRERMVLVQLPLGGDYGLPAARERLEGLYGLPYKVPQTTFNGLNSNILGKADYDNIKSKIEKQLKLPANVKLEASRTTNSGGTTIQGKIKNVGNSYLVNLVINGMVFRDKGSTGFRYSVTHIFNDEGVTIASLAPGEEKDFTINIPGLNWTGLDDGVIFVQSVTGYGKIIRQSLFIN